VAQRSAAAGERQHALQQVVEGVDRATHLVEQLLTLARLDPGAMPPRLGSLALRPLAVEGAALMAPRAMDKSKEISVAEGAATVAGDAAMPVFATQPDHNAIRYTPRGDGKRPRCIARRHEWCWK
jgi:two-component system sensor histidine kinase QseC